MRRDGSTKINQKKRTVKDLADYIKTRSGTMPNYSLFLGAGASVTSGIMTAVELVNEWRKEIFERLSAKEYIDVDSAKEWLSNNEIDWYDLSNEYSSLFEKKFDLPAQRRRFVEEQVDKKLPSIGYAYLVELCDRKLFDTVFTTNFDDLINEAFYQLSAERPLLCAHDSSIKGVSITSSRPKIIKLHGDYLFDGIKSSLNETESLEVNTKEKLIEFTKEYGLIFIGYAGNDRSIMDVLNTLLKQDEYLKNGVYWCHRKNDIMSPELTKFLLKERVYLVEIDGFDEFMAELFHEITHGASLSLTGAPKSTKRERMIEDFISDKFELTSNKYIQKDLKQIRKNTFTQDISSLINDLSDDESFSDKIQESSFRGMLYVDGLIKSKNYDQAEVEIKKLLNTSIETILTSRFTERLIDIYALTERLEKALSEADKLIEIDPFNLDYCIIKSNLIKFLPEKIKYLKSLISKHKYSYPLRNELARISLKYASENRSIDVTSSDEINQWLEESLKIDGSLDNHVWGLKIQSVRIKHLNEMDKKKENEEIESLLLTMQEINPLHTQYLDLKSTYVCKSNDVNLITDTITILNDAYKTSSINKRKIILDHLCSINSSIIGFEDKGKATSILKSFFSEYKELTEKNAIASYYLCKAKYLIAYQNDVSEATILAKKAIESQWASDEASTILEVLSTDSKNSAIIEEFIRNLTVSSDDVLNNKVLVDYYCMNKDYDLALAYLNKSYENGLDLSLYLTNKSFIYLCAGEYEQVLNIVESNISNIKDVTNKNILIVNRELAKKKLGMDLKTNELRTVIATDMAKSTASMCAHFILDEKVPALRIMKNLIDRNYLHYYSFSYWPAVPAEELKNINPLRVVA